MRHRRAGSKLGRLSAHRWALFRNLLTALFRHERITTTMAKAKAVRPLADRLVTLAKRDSLHARRQALALVQDPSVVRRLFDTIGARFSDRRGGYTRIVPAGTRRGDAAPLALLELMDRPAPSGEKKAKGKRKGEAAPTGKAAKKARKAAAAAGAGG
jgi:large subunit ribosomal protein L17